MATENKIIPVFTLGYQLNEYGEAEITCHYEAPPEDDVNSEILQRIMNMATITFVPEWLISDDPEQRDAGLELLNEMMNGLLPGG